MRPTVLDTCVLYPAALRDLRMHLTARFVRPEGTRPKWTPRIQEERIRSVLADGPDLKPEQLARTRALMEAWGRDWEVLDAEPKVFLLAVRTDRASLKNAPKPEGRIRISVR